jgi:coronin-1B/1C/6
LPRRPVGTFDLRSSDCQWAEAVGGGEGHVSVKAVRLMWIGETERLALTGFSKMSDGQVGIW